MCNLYDIGRPRGRKDHDREKAIVKILEEVESTLEKRFGIRKTDPGLVVTDSGSGPEASLMRWGFDRPFNNAVNNARSDKLDGMWSTAWEKRQRCLIPVSTFYEWTGSTGSKQTYAFQSPDDDAVIWAAGLWEDRKGERAYSMLTTNASEQVSEIHHRMPVLLRKENHEKFLKESNPVELLAPWRHELEIFRCYNPLKNSKDHKGPQREDFLPGF